jgi:hypothetical protein
MHSAGLYLYYVFMHLAFCWNSVNIRACKELCASDYKPTDTRDAVFLLAIPTKKKKFESSRPRVSHVRHCTFTIKFHCTVHSQSVFKKWCTASMMEARNKLSLNLNAFPIKLKPRSWLSLSRMVCPVNVADAASPFGRTPKRLVVFQILCQAIFLYNTCIALAAL